MTSPKTRNALSLEMLSALIKHITEDVAELRCVVIQGEGEVFSSGHNLKELTLEQGNEKHAIIFEKCNQLMTEIHKCPVPVIASVNGIATAAGCQLVSMCDIVVATKKSMFSTPGGKVGIFCSTPGVPLARVVPRKVSAYMLLTGNAISAEDAFRSGLISRLVEENELEAEIRSVCNAIKSKPRAVISLGKEFYYHQLEMNLLEALEEGKKVMLENLMYADAQEGIKAFVEKRNPVWLHTNTSA